MNALNLKTVVRSAFASALVLFAVSAFAGSKGTLALQHPTSVGGKQLATGNYTVQWDGTGDQVDVKVYQGKKEVASSSAQVVKMDRTASYDQTITSTGDGGSSSLAEIRFRGKSFALRLAGEGGGSSSGGAAR